MTSRTTWTRSAVLALAALTALLTLLTLPVDVVAATCACDPIQPWLVTDRFDETHVVYRTASNNGLVYATNKSGSWVKTRMTTTKDEPYAIAVDRNQHAYLVFRREDNDTVHFYMLSNKSGAWVRYRLSIIQDDVYRIQLQVDASLHLHFALTRDEATYYATNASGAWTRRRLDHAMGNNARIALDGDGHVHLVFEQCTNDGVGTCDGAGIYYQTNASGAWTTTRISTDQQDYGQDLQIDAAGHAHLVFVRTDNSQAQPNLPLGVFYMTNASGTWRTTRLAASGRLATLERNATTGAISIFYTRIDSAKGIYVVSNATGAWVRSAVVVEWAMYPTSGIDSRGTLHVAYFRMAIDPGVYYANDAGDGWTKRELLD